MFFSCQAFQDIHKNEKNETMNNRFPPEYSTKVENPVAESSLTLKYASGQNVCVVKCKQMH